MPPRRLVSADAVRAGEVGDGLLTLLGREIVG